MFRTRALFRCDRRFIFHRNKTTSVFATLWVELVVIGVLWLLYLGKCTSLEVSHLRFTDTSFSAGGAAAMASQLGGIYYCSGSSICGMVQALEAFAWLAWCSESRLTTFVVVSCWHLKPFRMLALSGLVGLLVVTAFIEMNRGRKSVWLEPYHLEDKAEGEANTKDTPMSNA